MEITNTFAPLYDAISPNDPITIVATGDDIDNLSRSRSLTMLGHYLHDVLRVPYSQIVVLIGMTNGMNLSEEQMKEFVGHYLYKKCTIIQHHQHAGGFRAGKTRKGREIEIDPMLIRRKVILSGENLMPVVNNNTMTFEDVDEVIGTSVDLQLQMDVSDEYIDASAMERELEYYKTIKKPLDEE